MPTQTEMDDFDKLFAQDTKLVDDAHGNGVYGTEIQELLSLSGQAETGGTIAVIPTAEYSKLIALVERASAMNLSQAQLKERIVALGSTVVSIAKKIKGLAAILA